MAGRLGLSRRRALGLAAFLALNGTVFIVHLYIAYADLPLAFFTLGAAALIYLWLADAAPRGSLLPGGPLSGRHGLVQVRRPAPGGHPPSGRGLDPNLAAPPWDLAPPAPPQPPPGRIALRLPPLAPLLHPAKPPNRRRPHPGLLSAAIRPGHLVSGRGPDSPFLLRPPLACPALAAIHAGRRLWTSPILFLALFLGGNLLAIILAYGVAPTSAAEFPSYVRATLDRLLLHLTPTAALLLALGLKTLKD